MSAVLLAGLAVVWYLAATESTEQQRPGTALDSPADLDAYLAEHPLPGVAGSDDPVLRIPTGVFI